MKHSQSENKSSKREIIRTCIAIIILMASICLSFFAASNTKASENKLNLSIGIAGHIAELDGPRIRMRNPLGTVRLEYKSSKRIKIFCEHVSSIPEYDNGLNMCGTTINIFNK